MDLLVFLITVACFTVVVSDSLTLNQENCTTTESPVKASDVTTEILAELDEAYSRCGSSQIDIRELTIDQIQAHFQSGKLTSVELTECYLRRISKIDFYLKSVIELNNDAISLADKTDRFRDSGPNRSRMYGIPILIKDNIGTLDSMQTTAGAKALLNVKPLRDADVVQRLRSAGAIILGKTNPSEWAKDNDIPSGWSSRGGQTVSAYVLEADPSGSSTGSAVSISANMAAVSLGTETDGSIISPSARGGLVGLKPTFGSVSTKGVIPLTISYDVVGPMTRTVQDAAILMKAISDMDLKGCDVDVSTCLADVKFKIGVIRYPFWNVTDPEIKNTIPVLNECLVRLRTKNLATIIDPVSSPVPIVRIRGQNEEMIFEHEFKVSINNYLANDVNYTDTQSNRTIYNLDDIIKYNQANQHGYNQNLLKLSAATDGLTNTTYLNAKNELYNNSIQFLDRTFNEYGVDALATPCFSDDTQNLYSYGAFAGYPSISVPVGVDALGMPIALCLTGKPNSEPELLKLGYFIELSRNMERPKPHFKKEVRKARSFLWFKF